MTKLKSTRRAYWPKRIQSMRVGPDLLALLDEERVQRTTGPLLPLPLPLPLPPGPLAPYLVGKEDWDIGM